MILKERASGADRSRPVLAQLLRGVSGRGTLVVDRLARSVSHLLAVIEKLEASVTHLRSLRDPIDTSTPQEMFSLQVLGAVRPVARCLERLTEPPNLVEADECAAEDVEGQENVSAALVAHAQAPEAVQPGVGAFHHPAVASEALTVVYATPGNTGPDAADAAFLAAAPVVIALVGVQLVGPSSRSARLPLRTGGMASSVGASMRLSC